MLELLFDVLYVIFIIACGLYGDKLTNMIGKWYWDYTIYSIKNPCVIDRKIYELCRKYESVNKIISFIYTFIYDFDKMKKLSIKLTITIECVTCLYRFIKICYAESWIG